MKQLLAMLVLLLTATVVQAAPKAFQATYTVSVKGITMGSMQARLSYSEQGYTYQKLTTANGLAALFSGDTLTERSDGKRSGEQLIPQHYLHHHKNKRKDKRDEFDFIAPNKVAGKYQQDAYQLAVPAGTLDNALLELHLMDDLASGKALNYNIVSKGKLSNYRFKKQGKETIEVPAGKYECEKVSVIHEDGKRQTSIWLAPAQNHAIIKIHHKEANGDLIESQLQRYQAI